MSDNNKIETTLWKTADKLRNNMDAAEYKHVVLGLIFLKYISDSFEELYNKLKSEGTSSGADPEDKDEYTAERVFYVPPVSGNYKCRFSVNRNASVSASLITDFQRNIILKNIIFKDSFSIFQPV
jgi:type I restriction-modification system DNA methylase subunit